MMRIDLFRLQPVARISPLLVALTILLVGLAPAPAAAVDDELVFQPVSPTELDPITVVLRGTSLDACVPELVGAVLSGSRLVLELENGSEDDACASVITPYELTYRVGRLPAGSYDVSAEVGPGPDPFVLAEAQLEVTSTVDLGLDTVDVSPEAPTSQDRITLSVHGTWPDSCVPRFEEVRIEERTLRVYGAATGQNCLAVLTDFSLTASVGPLPEGEWNVEVVISDRRSGDTAARFELAGQRSFTVAPAADDVLVLGGRFTVSVTWNAPDGESGEGQPLRGALPDGVDSGSGAFSFFTPDNAELLVKVLDGCAVNGHFWVFFSAATDLGFKVEVADTDALGVRRTYTQEPGEPARAVTDVEAFATCDFP